jgi:hypothetical protein
MIEECLGVRNEDIDIRSEDIAGEDALSLFLRNWRRLECSSRKAFTGRAIARPLVSIAAEPEIESRQSRRRLERRGCSWKSSWEHPMAENEDCSPAYLALTSRERAVDDSRALADKPAAQAAGIQ